ncbi:hypothetical protein ACQCSX_04230 [Pseudarthrobacter sp. P1]|uniref:hypothetical protein n=1 Tax=Pseudarthrobacter sp. P1 TaxID=3418418 RepID=UPI003CF9C8C6
MSLPTIRVSIDCGACYAPVEHDGDQYVCFDCGLCWATDDVFDDSPAAFLDEDATPCGEPSGDRKHVDVQPFRTINGVVKEWREWTHVYTACNLPAGHTSTHEFPLTTTHRDLEATA